MKELRKMIQRAHGPFERTAGTSSETAGRGHQHAAAIERRRRPSPKIGYFPLELIRSAENVYQIFYYLFILVYLCF